VVTDDFLTTLNLENKASLIGTITGMFTVGSCFGAIIAFTVGNPLGRKKTILVGTTLLLIGAITQAASYNIATMISGRIIAGLGNGINTSTAPIWQSETSKASWRGKLVIIELIMCVVGFSFVAWLGYGLSFVGGPICWRLPLAFQCFFLLILYATVPWLPESPRWLVSKRRVEEAKEIIAALENVDSTDPFVIKEAKEMELSIQYELENSPTLTQTITGRAQQLPGTRTIFRLILGCGALVMKELTGINVTSYYLPTVLIQSVGLSNSHARLVNACNTIPYLLASFLGIPFIERYGRRKLLMWGAAGQSFCYLFITVFVRYSELNGYKHQSAVAKASIPFFFLFYICFGIGWVSS
jgi:sugar porter (SP) family MFS transporter